MRNILKWSRGLLLLSGIILLASCGNSQKLPCVQHSECKSGERCGLDGFCTTEKQTCQSSNECAVGEICLSGSCKHVECGTDQAKCVERGFFCNQKGFCEDGCSNDGQCDTEHGYTCDTQAHVCRRQGCLVDSDCKDAPYQNCDKSAGQTVGKCVYNGSCSCENDPNDPIKEGEQIRDYCKRISTGDDICQKYASRLNRSGDYVCRFSSKWACEAESGCARNSDCPDHQLCVSVDGKNVCRPGCDDNDRKRRCSANESCLESPAPISWKTCQPVCITSSDCPASKPVCFKERCEASCRDDDDCNTNGKDGYICAFPTTGGTIKTCMGCLTNGECKGAKICDLDALVEKQAGGENRGLCKDADECPVDNYGNNSYSSDIPTPPLTPVNLPFEASETAPGGFANFCKIYNKGVKEFYRVNLAAGQILTATLGQDSSKGDRLSLSIVDLKGLTLSSFQPRQADNNTFELKYGTKRASDIYAVVQGEVTRSYAPYSISLTAEDAPTTCPGTEYDGTGKAQFTIKTGANGKPLEGSDNGKVYPEKNGEYEYVCASASTESKDIFKQKVPKDYFVKIILTYDRTTNPPIDLNIKDSHGTVYTVTEGKGPNTQEVIYTLAHDSKDRDLIYTLSVKDPYVGQAKYRINFYLEKYDCADELPNNDDAMHAIELPLPADSPMQEKVCKTGVTNNGKIEFDTCYGVCTNTNATTLKECRETKKIASLCSVDWFKIDLLPNRKFDFQLCYGGEYADASDGQPNVFLLSQNSATGFTEVAKNNFNDTSWKPEGAARCTGVTFTTGNSILDKNKPGTYYIKTNLYNGNVLKYRYSYRVNFADGANACAATQLGQNRDKASAEDMKLEDTGNEKRSFFGEICDANERWYKFTLSKDIASSTDESKQFKLALWHDPKHPIIMTVYSADGSTELKKTVVASGTTPGLDELKFENGLTKGTYYVKVSADPSARGKFELQVFDTKTPIAQFWCNDQYELNNDEAQATDINKKLPSATTKQTVEDLSLCGKPAANSNPTDKDVDIFKIDYRAGDHIEFGFAAPKEPGGSVSNFMSITGKNQYTSANSPQFVKATEGVLNRNFARTGTYYVKSEFSASVSPDTGRLVKLYDLTYKKTHVDCANIGEDNNHTSINAKELKSLPIFLYDKEVCESSPNSEDWYKVTVPKGKHLYVGTRYNKADYDIETTIYDSNGTTASAVTKLSIPKPDPQVPSLSYDALQWTTPAASASTTYYIKVASINGSRGRYALAVELRDSADNPDFSINSCPDRFKSANKDKNKAALLKVGTTDGLLLCRNSSKLEIGSPLERETNAGDFFKFDVPSKASLKVKVKIKDGKYRFDNNGSLDISLLNEDDTAAGTAKATTASGKDKSWVVETTNPGDIAKTYILKVALSGSTAGFAEYSIESSIVYTEKCSPTKSGNIMDTKASLSSASGATNYSDSVQLCEQNSSVTPATTGEEWVKLGKSFTDVHARIDYSSQFGKLKLELVKEDGSVVATATTSGNKLVLDKNSLSTSETYYLKITSPTNSRIKFKLWYSTTPTGGGGMGMTPQPYCQDEFEANESPTFASLITNTKSPDAWFVSKATLCGRDEDWYKVELPSGTYKFISYGFDNFADYSFTIYDSPNINDSKTASKTAEPADSSNFVKTGDLNNATNGNHVYYINVKAKTPSDTMNNRYGFMILRDALANGTEQFVAATNTNSLTATDLSLTDGVQVVHSGFYFSSTAELQQHYYKYTPPASGGTAKKLQVTFITFPDQEGQMSGDSSFTKDVQSLVKGHASVDVTLSTPASPQVFAVANIPKSGAKVGNKYPYILIVEEK